MLRHLIKLSLIALATVATFGVYETLLMVFPKWASVAGCVALVSVYVGLAYSGIPPQLRKTALSIALSAALIEICFNVVHAMLKLAPSLFTPPLPVWLLTLLVILFGVSFSGLAFTVSHLNMHISLSTSTVNSDQQITYMVDQTTRTLEMMQERILAMPTANHQSGEVLQALPKATKPVYQCPGCGGELASAGAYGAAVKHGYCKACKPVKGA